MRMLHALLAAVCLLPMASTTLAQTPVPTTSSHPAPGPLPAGAPAPPPAITGTGLMGLSGRWWLNAYAVQRLHVSSAQQKQMDAVFRESRPHLIDLSANMEKAEASLDLLLWAEHPDSNKISQQIDQVAEARAELEKANSKMLLRVLLLLTPEQWATLTQQAH